MPYTTLSLNPNKIETRRISETLSTQGHTVTEAISDADAVDKAEASHFDFMILDIADPSIEGWKSLIRVRALCNTPIAILSEINTPQHRINSYIYGADIYIGKPFGIDELSSRITALARRIKIERNRKTDKQSTAPECNPDINITDILHDRKKIGLTQKEFEIFRVLVEFRGEITTKSHLYERVYRRAFQPHDRSIDMHISKLRKKLSAFSTTLPRIVTLSGRGYMATISQNADHEPPRHLTISSTTSVQQP